MKGVRLYDQFLRGWARLAGRPACRRLNNFLLNLGLRGLGVGNEGLLTGERWLLQARARQWLRGVDNPVVIDGGANEGDYTVAMLATLAEARVYAFEPHPETSRRLRSRLNELGAQVSVQVCALGARETVLRLWDYTETEGSQHASLSREVIEQMHGGVARGYEVPVVTLDDFTKRNGITRIDWLKLDVEGFEFDCLRGAAELIAQDAVGVVQVEFNAMHRQTRTFCEDLVGAFPGHSWYRLLPRGLLPLPRHDVLRMELFEVQNLIGLPKGIEA